MIFVAASNLSMCVCPEIPSCETVGQLGDAMTRKVDTEIMAAKTTQGAIVTFIASLFRTSIDVSTVKVLSRQHLGFRFTGGSF